MAQDGAAGGGFEAVVVYDGRVLLVNAEPGQQSWELPSGVPQQAESARAGAARVVYELTGYLVDGSSVLHSPASPAADQRSSVICQLLTEDPSGNARLTPEQFRWVPFAEAIATGLPETVRTYLEGHTPV
ncbi:NUDIX domain-containing protein [Streptomyces sp. NPDC005423]|uniref:NUDIX domain-containing protein n=1 Tax=Streptomyces sp. NPDC005423 TaxID=3155343 RepID=UPI0033AFBBC1